MMNEKSCDVDTVTNCGYYDIIESDEDIEACDFIDRNDQINNEENETLKRKRSSISDNEIDEMLEEFYQADKSSKSNSSDENDENDDCNKLDGEKNDYCEVEKVVMVEKSRDHFDILPEGWIRVNHNSGLPIYLHKSSRVCSVSKPYFLGPGSARKHQIPISAIPCLNYRKAKESETESNNKETTNENVVEIKIEDEAVERSEEEVSVCDEGGRAEDPSLLPCAKIETAKENIENRSLTPDQIREYCSNLFEFKTLKLMKFKSWSNRRKFIKKRKMEKRRERPTLPENTKLITFPIYAENQKDVKREWIMNPNGKSYVCILHEYVQHVLKRQPTYTFSELENPSTPYSATVVINNIRYGVGYGSSKKSAKTDAAKVTLEILIPEMKDKIMTVVDKEHDSSNNVHTQLLDDDLAFFDEIKIDDPRVSELCSKTTEPSPHAILLTCLQRNHGIGDTAIKFEGSLLKHQKTQFTMTVGKHSATVICKNKREGKQLASQGILKALHPNLKSWGSLLRLYGSKSIKNFKVKKQEEQEITLLQNKATINKPNAAILEKLQDDMLKLYSKLNTNAASATATTANAATTAACFSTRSSSDAHSNSMKLPVLSFVDLK